jgi:hypothetical protein
MAVVGSVEFQELSLFARELHFLNDVTLMLHLTGMPYPQNLETAKEVEAVVRAGGAEPATIAILDGVPHIGLTAAELQRLASLGKVVVCSTAFVNRLTFQTNIVDQRETRFSVFHPEP